MPEDEGQQPDEFQAKVQEAVDKELGGLKSALAKTKEEKNKAKEALASYEGVDPKKYAALLKAEENREAEKLKAAGDWDEREKALRSQYEAMLGQEREVTGKRMSALEAQLQHELVESKALQAMTDSGVKEVVGLKPHILRHLKMVEEDGKYRTDVVDGNGDPMFKPGTTEKMGPQDLVKWMGSQEQFAWAFRGTGSAGGEAKGNASGAQGKSDAWVGNVGPGGAEIIT